MKQGKTKKRMKAKVNSKRETRSTRKTKLKNDECSITEVEDSKLSQDNQQVKGIDKESNMIQLDQAKNSGINNNVSICKTNDDEYKEVDQGEKLNQNDVSVS